MQNPSEQLSTLHQELIKFHDQIETEQDVKVWSKRSKKLKELLQKTKALLPSKTEKEQKRVSQLHKDFVNYHAPQKEEKSFGGFQYITVELFSIFIIPFTASIWLGLGIIGGLVLIFLLLAWRSQANKKNALLAKLRKVKRDLRYLSRVVEYECLSRKKIEL